MIRFVWGRRGAWWRSRGGIVEIMVAMVVVGGIMAGRAGGGTAGVGSAVC